MVHKFNARLLIMMMALTAAVYGCDFINSLGSAKIVKPEEMRHYKPDNTLVVFSVNRTRMPFLSTVMLMLVSAPTISVFPSQDKSFFIADIPCTCKGINRVGVIIDPQTPEDWFDDYTCGFTLESNKLNYLGQFIFILDPDTDKQRDKMIVTNCLADDKEWFLEYYPSLSNKEFVSVPVTNGLFYRIR